MLQQSLAGGAEQQSGKASTATGAHNHHIMGMAGLGQRVHGGTRYHGLVQLEVGVLLKNRRDTDVQVLLEGVHHALVAVHALHLRHGGDHVEFGIPGRGEVGGDLQRLDAPLRFVGTDGHLGDRVVQVHRVAFIIGIRHHHDRAVRVRRQAGAGGAQQPLGQTALAAVADDDQVVVARQFHEYGGRVSGDDQCGGLDALFVGDGFGLGQDLLGIAMRRVVIPHGGVRGVE